MKEVIVTTSFERTIDLGKTFAQKLKNGGVVALCGQLGAGKTTFVQGLALGLGVSRKIISPSFIVIRTYQLKERSLYHIDLYRIQDEKESQNLGLKEIINNKDNIVVIEWPEKIEELLTGRHIKITFSYLDENRRELTIETINEKTKRQSIYG